MQSSALSQRVIHTEPLGFKRLKKLNKNNDFSASHSLRKDMQQSKG
jgi:hypothetical protein